MNPPEQEAQLRLLADMVARQGGEDVEDVLRRALGVCDQDRRARRYVCAIVAQVVSEIAVQTMVQSDPRRTAAATQAIAHFIGWKPQE